MNPLVKIKSLTSLGVTKDLSLYEAARTKIINTICLFGILFVILANAILYLKSSWEPLNCLLFLLTFIFPLIANAFKKQQLATSILFLGGTAGCAVAAYMVPEKIIYFTIPTLVLPFFFDGKKMRLFFIIFVLVAAMGSYKLSGGDITEVTPIRLIVSFVCLVIANSFLVIMLNIKTKKAQELKSLLANIEDQKKTLKKKETELLKVTEKLNSQNKELESFVYIASHDLKEPIRNTISFIQLLKRKIGDQKVVESKKLALLENNAVHINRLISSLLEYSRIGKEDESSIIILKSLLSDISAEGNVQLSINQQFQDQLHLIGKEDDIKRLFSELIKKVFSNEVTNSINIEASNENSIFKCTLSASQNSSSEKHELSQNLGIAISRKIVDHYNGNLSIKNGENGRLDIEITLPQQSSLS